MTWVLFYLILPIIFAAILAIGVLQIIGFNVIGKIASPFNNLPFVRHLLREGPVPVPVPEQVANLELQVKGKTTQLLSLEAQVNRLQSQLVAMNGTLSSTESALKKANAKIASMQKIQVQISEQAQVYSNMDAGQAASILAQLPFRTEVLTLKAMDPTDQASILSDMDPKLAAKLLQAGA